MLQGNNVRLAWFGGIGFCGVAKSVKVLHGAHVGIRFLVIWGEEFAAAQKIERP